MFLKSFIIRFNFHLRLTFRLKAAPKRKAASHPSGASTPCNGGGRREGPPRHCRCDRGGRGGGPRSENHTSGVAIRVGALSGPDFGA